MANPSIFPHDMKEAMTFDHNGCTYKVGVLDGPVDLFCVSYNGRILFKVAAGFEEKDIKAVSFRTVVNLLVLYMKAYDNGEADGKIYGHKIGRAYVRQQFLDILKGDDNG